MAASAEEQEVYKNGREEKMLSIYDIYSVHKKRLILFIICFLGFLSSFDEIVYLPAIATMVKDFNTTATLGLFSISIYLFTISLSSLIWGVLSDFYGRKPIVTFGLGAFILSTIGCYFSSNIYIFLVCRALQGFFVSSTIVVGLGTIADLYQPNDRGSAFGIFYGMFFFAGLLGPTLGGQFSVHFGWRSTLILVTIISAVSLISYVLVVPETQQYKVICTYQKRRNTTLLETEQVLKPTLANPCVPLLYLSDYPIAPYVLVLVCGYITVNCSFLRFSTEAARAPYSYHADTIGIFFIPIATAFLLGSITGGKLSDLMAIKYFQTSRILEARIVPGLLFCVLTAIGLVIYGWTFQYGVHISMPLIGQMLSGFGQAATRPGMLSYLSIKYQDHAASINSAINFLQILLTSIAVPFTEQVVQAIRDGPFFTILAFGGLLTAFFAAVLIVRKIRLSKNSEKKLLL